MAPGILSHLLAFISGGCCATLILFIWSLYAARNPTPPQDWGRTPKTPPPPHRDADQPGPNE